MTKLMYRSQIRWHSLNQLEFAALALFGLVFSQPVRTAEPILVTQAWVREAPPNMSAHAAYAVLRNNTNQERNLVSANSSDYKMVELHLSKVTHGVASMVKQNQITIPSKGMVKMMPGGFHFMLMHPKRVLRAGDKIKITLGFADGSKQTFQAPIKKAPVASGKHHHMGH